ncbi:lipocalin-like domain-containing protein [Pedobacter hartonius]|uniref:Lipocalin-like domain-containing protein n=1 Tax=Pedobacter hartonius TaxID=425514 RepID=A0A1H4G933_9SPHI|nr:hypothetical protein [Pedobacter hartonius]SEB05947.1 hypothetical protein SAMN05443550_109121 [Pedobacter hartonius]
MKLNIITLLLLTTVLSSCSSSNEQKEKPGTRLKGTWKLVSGTKVSKGLTTFTDYTKDQQMIKIINDTHFAFLRHNIKPDAEGKNKFDAGGGRYQLAGDQYTEFLDYYNDRNWEGKKFTFKVTIKNDTLIQTGIEKIEASGIDQTITEKYLKVNEK